MANTMTMLYDDNELRVWFANSCLCVCVCVAESVDDDLLEVVGGATGSKLVQRTVIIRSLLSRSVFSSCQAWHYWFEL